MTPLLAKAAWAPLATALALTACSSTRQKECHSFTTLINTGADAIDKAQATPLDPTGLEALAAVLDRTSAEADGLNLSADELQKQAKDYASLLRDVAKTARDMASAGKAGDLEKAKAANAEMEKLTAAEPKLIADVNKLCSAK